MKTSIVPIGDSIGIKIPRTILEQCHIKKNVIMEVNLTKSLSSLLKISQERIGNGLSRKCTKMKMTN